MTPLETSEFAVVTAAAIGYGIGVAFVVLVLFTRRKGGE